MTLLSLRFATIIVILREAAEGRKRTPHFRNEPGPDIAQGPFLFRLRHLRLSWPGVRSEPIVRAEITNTPGWSASTAFPDSDTPNNT